MCVQHDNHHIRVLMRWRMRCHYAVHALRIPVVPASYSPDEVSYVSKRQSGLRRHLRPSPEARTEHVLNTYGCSHRDIAIVLVITVLAR